MKLSVGTNFDNQLLEELKGSPVTSVYGKLTEDIVGGGRPSFALPKVDESKVQEHINLAHKQGIEFNYLLNSVCLDNLELTADMNRRIIEFINILDEWKVDWITVTIPYLIELIKARYPRIKISVSSFAHVDSIQKAKHYEQLGVEEITPPESYNRNFRFLEELRKSVKLDIRLIATNDCLISCPFQHHHPIYQSHASQTGHVSGGFGFDFCLLRCTFERLKDPSQFIKACWIRPEDIKIYEEIGYDNFKLTERLKKTDKILKTIRAYQNKKWDGNLAEILNVRMSEEDFVFPNFKYLDRPEFADFGKITGAFRLLFKNKVYIDNGKLEGFIDFFKNKKFDCLETNCDTCNYCKKIAQNVVSIDSDQKESAIHDFEKLFQELACGDFFRKEETQMILIWPSEISDVFEKLIEAKPDFIREMSRKMMFAEAEKIAKERNSDEVNLNDVIKANFNTTPKEFHPMLVKGLIDMNIDVTEFVSANGPDY
jgi:collagenase-like PrtC family protease